LQKTKGPSDLYVQSNVWATGGSTGWHTHPGHSLIIVTAGAVTAYEGDDPSCTPKEYTAGMGFVDPGGDHVHLLRNDGPVEARTVAVQLIPEGAPRRIDAAAPAGCPF
jgi:quercetin dioxygenase-like cupin family protein